MIDALVAAFNCSSLDTSTFVGRKREESPNRSLKKGSSSITEVTLGSLDEFGRLSGVGATLEVTVFTSSWSFSWSFVLFTLLRFFFAGCCSGS